MLIWKINLLFLGVAVPHMCTWVTGRDIYLDNRPVFWQRGIKEEEKHAEMHSGKKKKKLGKKNQRR